MYNSNPVDIGEDLIEPPKFTKKFEINFEKTAKKVDVTKLKENLWNKLSFEQEVKS